MTDRQVMMDKHVVRDIQVMRTGYADRQGIKISGRSDRKAMTACERRLLLLAGNLTELVKYLTSLPRAEEHPVVATEQCQPGSGFRVEGLGFRV